MKEYYKTIVISDLHLGRKQARQKEVINFLKHSSCETLILNGDIIEKFELKKNGHWKKKHWNFVRTILDKIEEDETKVYYLKGNHDRMPTKLLPFQLGRIQMLERLEYESFGKKYLVVHGDIFDTYQGQFGWALAPGKKAYSVLFWFHQQIRKLRTALGLHYLSMSEKVKSRFSLASLFIDQFEQSLCRLAKRGGYQGVICGHLHIPSIKEINGVSYMNSGDWLESLSALVEYPNGEWNLVYYSESKGELSDEMEKEEKHLNSLLNYPFFNQKSSGQ